MPTSDIHTLTLDTLTLDTILRREMLEVHSWRNGHAICRDIERRNWAVIFPNGDVETDIYRFAVARAWVDT